MKKILLKTTSCLVFIPLVVFLFSGCASERKARQAERDKLSNSTGMYCDFVNGDQYHDVDVQMNLQMAKKCDPQKPFSISNFRNSSEMFGIVYCCNTNKGPSGATTTAKAPSNIPTSAAPTQQSAPSQSPTPGSAVPAKNPGSASDALE